MGFIVIASGYRELLTANICWVSCCKAVFLIRRFFGGVLKIFCHIKCLISTRAPHVALARFNAGSCAGKLYFSARMRRAAASCGRLAVGAGARVLGFDCGRVGAGLAFASPAPTKSAPGAISSISV